MSPPDEPPPAFPSGPPPPASPPGYEPRAPWGYPETAPISFGTALHLATPKVRATWVLLAANVAVFFWMVTMRGVDPRTPSPEQLLANGADSSRLVLVGGEWWRLLTSTFVHVGATHLAVNMYGLYALGPFTERLYGNLGFAAVWLVAGLFGSLASVLAHPDISASAGASGALFGVLGALAAYLIRQRRTIPPPVFKSLMRSVVLMVALNVLVGATVPHIDTAAHGGGAAAGFLCGLFLARPLTPRGVAGRGVRAFATAAAGVLLGAALLIAMTRR